MFFDCYAVVVAGGTGTRMQSQVRKQYLDLGGKPILVRTLIPFCTTPEISHTVLVVPEIDFQTCLDTVLLPHGLTDKVTLAAGGSQRQESVLNGLRAIVSMTSSADKTLVLIHDGVRPFVNSKLINECIRTAREKGACIPVVPVVDTLKRVGDDGTVSETVDRSGLFRAQTPQTFRLDLILDAHIRACAQGLIATDDASLVEALGVPVATVQGNADNIKITNREDLALAELLLRIRLN
ncbi:MAG: 2-C-methyl-D-erythritol 4-phosphate cytidylyltransferase [Pseudomonadota bacterium]